MQRRNHISRIQGGIMIDFDELWREMERREKDKDDE